MPHPLAPHLRLNDLDAALLAHHSPMSHPFVFSTIALVVLGGTKDLGAEKPVPLWFEGPVVDGLRLLDLAVGPRTDLFRRGKGYPNRTETHRIFRPFKETKEFFHW